MTATSIKVVELTLRSQIIYLVLTLLLIVLNSIELHILRKSRYKPFYEKILLSLTICDLITGLIGLPLAIFGATNDSKYYLMLFMCIWGYCVFYSILTSLLHLIIISLDRLWSIRAPLHHKKFISKKKLIISVALSWGIPMVLLVANLMVNFLQKMTVYSIYSYLVTTIWGALAKVVLIADIVFILSYSSIIWVVVTTGAKDVQNGRTQRRKSASTIYLCLGIVTAFIVFTTPFVIVYITRWDRPNWMKHLSVSMLSVNLSCNSLIYLFQKYRNRRMGFILRERRNARITPEDTRV